MLKKAIPTHMIQQVIIPVTTSLFTPACMPFDACFLCNILLKRHDVVALI